MILTLWLDQPVWLIFAVLAVLFFGATLIFCGLTRLARTRTWLLKLGSGMVPTYFTAISVLLALLTGFVANDAWERQREAGKVLQTERANARAVHDLSLAAASDMAGIRSSLSDYLDAVIRDEWPKMASGGSSSEAGNRLSRLLEAVADPRIGMLSGGATHAALLNAAMSLRAARGDRLALSESHGDETKWLTLLILAGLTLVAIGLVHLEKPLAQATALLLFSTAMVSTLGMIALHERPFDGPLALSAEPLRMAVKTNTDEAR